MSARTSTDWRPAARTALRLTLHTTGWLLDRGGRGLQHLGELLNSGGKTLRPRPPDPRRE